MKYSINAACFEGICRIYRNSCVRHIRTILKHKYPEDYEQRIKRLFKDEEWQSITRNAEMFRKTGEIESPLVDGIDVLSVNHFCKCTLRPYTAMPTYVIHAFLCPLERLSRLWYSSSGNQRLLAYAAHSIMPQKTRHGNYARVLEARTWLIGNTIRNQKRFLSI